MTDEEFLYQCYHGFATDYQKKSKKSKGKKSYKKDFEEINRNAQLVLMRLTSDATTMIDLNKNALRGKNMYIQFFAIKQAIPELVPQTMVNTIDKLIREVCRREVEMLELVRVREVGGERIDIEEIFSYEKYLMRLKNELAQVIVADAIKDADIVFSPIYYITATGTKYHRKDCPYCRGRQLNSATKKMVEMQKLTPCKCVERQESEDDIDYSCVTAYVDEAIRTTQWDENGMKGKSGSYSYIICWGDLKDESEITPERIIAQGVDYTSEHHHCERITESAIGKVLITLAYDYEYRGPVQIFTDNKPAALQWEKDWTNKQLSALFNKVVVSHIPRESNKKADKLGRTRVHLDMPMECYTDLVDSDIKEKQLKNRIEKLERSNLLQQEKIGELTAELDSAKGVIAAYKPSAWERFKVFLKERFSITRAGQVIAQN